MRDGAAATGCLKAARSAGIAAVILAARTPFWRGRGRRVSQQFAVGLCVRSASGSRAAQSVCSVSNQAVSERVTHCACNIFRMFVCASSATDTSTGLSGAQSQLSVSRRARLRVKP